MLLHPASTVAHEFGTDMRAGCRISSTRTSSPHPTTLPARTSLLPSSCLHLINLPREGLDLGGGEVLGFCGLVPPAGGGGGPRLPEIGGGGRRLPEIVGGGDAASSVTTRSGVVVGEK
jgi:hypothetical protein